MRTGLAGSLMGHEKHDWGLVSVPQIHANGQQVPQPRYVHITRQTTPIVGSEPHSGKGLGGSSLVRHLRCRAARSPSEVFRRSFQINIALLDRSVLVHSYQHQYRTEWLGQRLRC